MEVDFIVFYQVSKSLIGKHQDWINIKLLITRYDLI